MIVTKKQRIYNLSLSSCRKKYDSPQSLREVDFRMRQVGKTASKYIIICFRASVLNVEGILNSDYGILALKPLHWPTQTDKTTVVLTWTNNPGLCYELLTINIAIAG